MRRSQPGRAPTAAECAVPLAHERVGEIIDNDGHFNSHIMVTWRYNRHAYDVDEDYDPTWLVWKGCVIMSRLVEHEPVPARVIRVLWMFGDKLDTLGEPDEDGLYREFFPPKAPIDVLSMRFHRIDPLGPTEGPVRDFPNDSPSSQAPSSRGGGISARLGQLRDAGTGHAHITQQYQELRQELKSVAANLTNMSRTVDLVASQQLRSDNVLTQLMMTAPLPSERASDVASTASGPLAWRSAAQATPRNTTVAAAPAASATAAPDDDERDLIPESPPTIAKAAKVKDPAPELFSNALSCTGEGADGKFCNFSCVDFAGRGLKRLQQLLLFEFQQPRISVELATWIAAHGLCIPRPSVCGHVTGKVKEGKEACKSTSFGLRRLAASGNWVCNRSVCGMTRSIKTPAMCNIWAEIHFTIFILGAGDRRLKADATMQVFSPKATTELIRRLCRAALLVNSECVKESPSWDNMQWDETFHSQRKFQRGRRVRASGVLTFVGGVTMTTDDEGNTKIAEGIIASVPNKSRFQQLGLLLAMVAPGAEVSTDSATMYRDLKTAALNHKSVNHSKEFMAADGTHTNAVEGFWSVLKRRLRMWWGSQSVDAVEVSYRYQLCAYFANASFAGMTTRAAALSLYRLLVTYEQSPAIFEEKVQAAGPVFCLPREKTIGEVDAVVAHNAAVEEAFVKELAEHAATDADFPKAVTAIQAHQVTDPELPLNQESNHSGDDLLPPVSKAHRAEFVPAARSLDFGN